MKITVKGNSTWLVLTGYHSGKAVIVRTREIHVIEQGNDSCGTAIFGPGIDLMVKENYIDILRALDVNIPTIEIES